MKVLVCLLAITVGAAARDRVGLIEFFGYGGIDVDAVRRALPFHEGDPFPEAMKQQAREAVRRAIGRDATDVAQLCCVGDGDAAIFIGLPGTSMRPFRYDAAPAKSAPVSSELAALADKEGEAVFAAVQKGESAEDGSPGYRLMKEPAARAAELALREYAVRHEDEIIRTLQNERRAGQRAIAADALGFGGRSPRQIAALVRAVRDPDDLVRNNVTRALWEILRGDPAAASQIPPDPFIGLVSSGVWSDRNKGSLVLEQLAAADARLRDRIRSEAGDALREMASWREEGWASSARAILGRP